MAVDIEKIRIGTRASALALWQSNWIKLRLEELHDGLKVELVKIQTSGDKIQDAPLAKIGGKCCACKNMGKTVPNSVEK